MKKINTTSHAKKRMQQRAISEMQVRLVQEFGQYQYQKGGDNFAFIPEKILADLRQAIDKLSKVAIVLGESDKVVTAMHQRCRIHTTRYVA